MRVLVCDDDLEVGPVIAKLFQFEGWTTHLVTSGQACLDAVRGAESLPDVVVLDQVMPEMLGLEVAEQLRADGFERPIVLCSAYLGPELAAGVERLDLLTVSKIDLEALTRICRNATLAAAPETDDPDPRLATTAMANE